MDPPPAYSTLVSVSKLGHNSENNGTDWATAPPTVTLTDEAIISNGVETGRTTDRGNVEDTRSEAGDLDVDQFTETLSSQLEMFVTRMQSDCSRGRPIAGDSCVQSMFLRLMALHGRLVGLARAQEGERARYEELQDKVSQVQDARAALDALRSGVTYWCAIYTLNSFLHVQGGGGAEEKAGAGGVGETAAPAAGRQAGGDDMTR